MRLPPRARSGPHRARAQRLGRVTIEAFGPEDAQTAHEKLFAVMVRTCAAATSRRSRAQFDGVVVERLRQGGGLRGVVLIDAHTDLLAHLHRFAEADEVVLIDAVLDDRDGVALVGEEEFSGWDHTSGGAQQVSPLAAVKLFRRLHPEAATRIRLVAQFVREEDFRLSPDDAAIRDAADVVRGCVCFCSR